HLRQIHLAVEGVRQQGRQHDDLVDPLCDQGGQGFGGGGRHVIQVGHSHVPPWPQRTHPLEDRRNRRGRTGIATAVRHRQQRDRLLRRVHPWIPHSVLPVPAQRPLRGSSPGATRCV